MKEQLVEELKKIKKDYELKSISYVDLYDELGEIEQNNDFWYCPDCAEKIADEKNQELDGDRFYKAVILGCRPSEANRFCCECGHALLTSWLDPKREWETLLEGEGVNVVEAAILYQMLEWGDIPVNIQEKILSKIKKENEK